MLKKCEQMCSDTAHDLKTRSSILSAESSRFRAGGCSTITQQNNPIAGQSPNITANMSSSAMSVNKYNSSDDAMFATPPASPSKNDRAPVSEERKRSRSNSMTENEKPKEQQSPAKETLAGVGMPKPLKL